MKTLKDIEVCFVPCDGECDWYTQSFIDGCREATREWINLLEKDLAKLQKELIKNNVPPLNRAIEQLFAKIDWIKHFFNLTEV